MRHFVRSLTLFLSLAPCVAQVNVLTSNYSNDRANANLAESKLNPGNVTLGSFGKLGSFPVDGQVYAQPLYASAVDIPGSGTHSVLFVCTQHNTVYAYDADSVAAPNLLWKVNFGPSVPSTTFGDYGDVAPEIGILSTPAIDGGAGVMYVVSDTLRNGVPVLHLHALDIRNGQELLNGPATIAGQVAGTGVASNNGAVVFDPMWHIQRPGLLLANGNVMLALGSHADDGPWHGWLFTFAAADLSQAPAIWNVTPNGAGGSIWQSGRGLAADNSGNVYAISGNGDYDGVTNFSQSLLKFSGNMTNVADWFTPPNWQFLSDNDFDLSAGPALIPGTNMLLAADKAGQLYLANSDSLGRGVAGTAVIFAAVPSGGIFNMAVWPRPDGAYVYVPQLNSTFQCFQVVGGTFNQTPLSASLTGGTDPYSGLAISANGTQDGNAILWATTVDNTHPDLPGTLHAYDATNLANELWNSDMSGGADTLGSFSKFVSPTVVNGNVYVPTWSNAVVVYGLLPAGGGQAQPAIGGIANSASYSVNAVSPGELVTIFGSNIGPSDPAGMQIDSSGNLLSSIGGTQVLFDGIPAPMIYASQSQVNAVVPFAVNGPTTKVEIVSGGQISAAFPMSVLPATPGVFTSDGSGTGQAAAVNQDYSLNSVDNPAPPGSVLTIYADGSGVWNPAPLDGSVVGEDNLPHPALPVSVTVGGQQATVRYSGGAPGMVAGMLQVNFQLPDGVPAGPAVPVVLQIGDTPSTQTLTVAVQ